MGLLLKYFLAILTLALIVPDLHAATSPEQDAINLKRYWFYRYRLVNDFMAVGDCQGCSEPMNQRAWGGTNSKWAKWGDQTVSLGHYIAVLATEYKLLADQGQSVENTIKELYFAIRAFNRLDQTAEINVPAAPHSTPQPSDLNGFFIRDDVPANFLSLHPKLAAGVTSTRSISFIDSDFVSPDLTTKEMSQDQIWYLFTGFALVRKCLPESLIVSYQGLPLNDVDGNANIRLEVAHITNRIIDRLKANSWLVRNPNTGALVTRGFQAGELSYGAAEAACFINNPNDVGVSIIPVVHTCDASHDAITFINSPLWMTFATLGSIAVVSTEDYKLQQIAAIGNSWYSSAFATTPDPVTLITTLFDPNNFLHPWQFLTTTVQNPPIYPDNITMSVLSSRAIIRDNQHLPLLRQVLHGGGNLVPQSFYENLLNTAPCSGPFCFAKSHPGGPCATFEWSAWDRLHFSEERSPDSKGSYEDGSQEGEYNGLDYLLYYNLFHLVVPSTVPHINYMDRNIGSPFPTTSQPPIGTLTNPAHIEAFNELKAANHISAQGDVIYRAGVEIKLLPGFTASAGSRFRGYIQSFQCGTDGTYQ
jgi:hypothetical protein